MPGPSDLSFNHPGFSPPPRQSLPALAHKAHKPASQSYGTRYLSPLSLLFIYLVHMIMALSMTN